MRQISSDSSTDSSNNSFNSNNLPSIFAFPKDGNSWRIDWFGDVAFPNRMLRRTQPSVFVHLSRVLDSSFLEDPAVLLPPDSTLVSKQRKVWISVGTLPLLAIGDIWKDGQLEMRPDYELEHFADLDINATTAVLVKAGLNLEENGFLLPRAEHPWHMQCTQSYCLMVRLPQNRRLIIPCMELIRFYFGSSSNLLTKLFLPPLQRDSLYSNPQFDKPSGRLTLQLATNISGASAADIGRLHMAPAAWRAAAHVGASLLKASVSGQGAYPQAYFPFEGQTNLTASGKWLSLGEEARASFVVYNLRSCSHPFPFRSLRYESKDNRLDPAQRGQSGPSQSTKRRHRSADDSHDQRLVEKDASNELVQKKKQVRFAPRFPDLRKKTIWKNRSLSTIYAAQLISRADRPPVEQAAIGDPGSELRVRPINLAILSSEQQPVPEFLRDPVKELLELQGLQIELLTESEEDGWTVPVTMLSNEDGEIDLGFCVEEKTGELRL
ncbi:MAG: hypothetical protein HYS18_06490 [Burkholderiales bacterium]|nr:hypothetical protein [Burkholderiales bacterium]